MGTLVLGCVGDSYSTLRLCKGIENNLFNLSELNTEELQWLNLKLPKRKIFGGRTCLRILSELNIKKRNFISLAHVQGFIAFHATHNEDDNCIYLEVR